MRHFSRITIICIAIATALIFTSCSPTQYTEAEQPKPSETKTEVSDTTAAEDADTQAPAEQGKPIDGSTEATIDQPTATALAAQPDTAKDAELNAAEMSALGADAQPAKTSSQPATQQKTAVQPANQPKPAAPKPAPQPAAQKKPAVSKPAASAGVSAADIEKTLNSIAAEKYSAAKRDPALDKKAAAIASAMCSGRDTDSLLADLQGQSYTQTGVYIYPDQSISQVSAAINKALGTSKKDVIKYGTGLASSGGKTVAVVLSINKPTPPAKIVSHPVEAPDMAQKIFAEINRQRKTAGATALAWNQALANKAKKHALDMAKNNRPDDGTEIFLYRTINEGSSVSQAALDLLQSYVDMGTIIKEPGKDAVIGGENPSPSIPAQYTYPYLQSSEYKSVGVGVYHLPEIHKYAIAVRIE